MSQEVKIVKCRFCKEVISQDRYNLYIRWERQDRPFESEWIAGSFPAKENICDHCFSKIEYGMNRAIEQLVKEEVKLR